MEEDKTIIGVENRRHRLIHSFITVPFLIFEGIMFYLLYTSPNPEMKDWLIAFTLIMISVPYFIVLISFTRSLSETVIIDKYNLTLIHRTLLLTIPSAKTISLNDIAFLHRDDNYLHLYDNKHKLLLDISDKINETTEIVEELKKRLPNIEYSKYSVVSNVTQTYKMPAAICMLAILFWIGIGAMMLIFPQEKFISSIIVWCVTMLLLIFYSSQKVVLTGDRLIYTGRNLFLIPFEEVIQISDIASMGGSRFELVLYDKDGKPLMEMQKNVFFYSKLTRAIEIRISNREEEEKE